MLSVARLDKLCGRRLQRIGLSATIEPLELAAAYLSPERPLSVHLPWINRWIYRLLVRPLLWEGGRIRYGKSWEWQYTASA